MKTQKFNPTTFIVAGLAGGVIYFLLGWLFYGILFAKVFPAQPESTNTMIFIALGCIAFGLLLSYIFNKWGQITKIGTGAKAGAILGLLIGLYQNFFHLAMESNYTTNMAITDIGISIVMAAIAGAIVAIVSGKMS